MTRDQAETVVLVALLTAGAVTLADALDALKHLRGRLYTKETP